MRSAVTKFSIDSLSVFFVPGLSFFRTGVQGLGNPLTFGWWYYTTGYSAQGPSHRMAGMGDNTAETSRDDLLISPELWLRAGSDNIFSFWVQVVNGLGLDFFLLNEFGPHLIVFMLVLIIFYSTFKYLNNLKTLNMYLMLLVTQITIILFEKIISQLMFGFYFNLNDFLEIAIFSIILSYPVFYIFSKIDRLK